LRFAVRGRLLLRRLAGVLLASLVLLRPVGVGILLPALVLLGPARIRVLLPGFGVRRPPGAGRHVTPGLTRSALSLELIEVGAQLISVVRLLRRQTLLMALFLEARQFLHRGGDL